MTQPTAAEFADLWLPRLEPRMLVNAWEFRHGFPDTVVSIDALLKPQPIGTDQDIAPLVRLDAPVKSEPSDGSGRAARRMFMDVLDGVLVELASLGAEHTRHPEVRISGHVVRRLGGPDSFAGLKCAVDFQLIGRR